MLRLELPFADLIIRQEDSKSFVFDRLRRRFVRLTPEEWVRQHFIHFLIQKKNYPEGLLANEVSIVLGAVDRRCDTVLYDTFLQPRMIIEYKAPTVGLSQKTFDQILRYNLVLGVPWLIVTNGLQHFCCRVDAQGKGSFVDRIPDWSEL
jgi:hypothetical protein